MAFILIIRVLPLLRVGIGELDSANWTGLDVARVVYFWGVGGLLGELNVGEAAYQLRCSWTTFFLTAQAATVNELVPIQFSFCK